MKSGQTIGVSHTRSNRGSMLTGAMRQFRQGPAGRNLSFLAATGLKLALLFVLHPVLSPAQSRPPGFDDLVSKANAARESNDVAQAIDLYGKALQLDPKWPDGWWYLGSLQYTKDSYAAARDSLTHYIDLTPSPTAALALRGFCEFETGEYVQSLNDIQRALSMGAANQPRNEKILRFREAELLTRNGRFEEALQGYAFFAHDQDKNPEVYLGLGLAGLRQPLLPKELPPAERDLYGMAGDAGFRLMAGDQADAKQAFEALFQRFPRAANAHYFYGYLLFTVDPELAIVEFTRELEVSPDNVNGQSMMAWSELSEGNPAAALPYAQRAVALQPLLPVAQLVLGRSLVETGRFAEGMEHLQKALQLQPENLEIHIALARAYSESGRKEDARRERLLSLEMTKGGTNHAAQP